MISYISLHITLRNVRIGNKMFTIGYEMFR